MTTKPKAKKFRIRRSSPVAAAARPAVGATTQPQQPAETPQPTQTTPQQARPAQPQPQPAPPAPQTADPEAEIAEIRKEGLTGRQLRMARRVAQKHGLSPISDFDAVRQLRQRGIDPFQRLNMLELVVNEQGKPDAPTDNVQLPQTVAAPAQNLPSTHVAPPSSAADQVRQIQVDIARRRRRKTALMFARLLVFVCLPSVLTSYYYYNIATPMYATHSEMIIQTNETAGAGGLGNLFGGSGLATSQDSILVQGYLQSRDAMQRLDADLGFKAHFSQPQIDSLQRLEEGASNEAAYRVYKKKVKIGYDPTEGVLKMEVIAADPDISAAFSDALISYAEQRVDSQTQRLREDQMAGALQSFNDADARVQEAQARVLSLQERMGVFDPTTEVSALMGQISTFELQLREKRLQLQQLLDNARPNQARVNGVEGDIARLETLIEELRSSLTQSSQGTDSLARVAAELRIAEADLANRQLMQQAATQQMETARIEANRQSRYLSRGVDPVAPDEATYPRAFENTLMAFLIFGGIFLMISMTASILREQVSA
ncbi:capsule biosynthesis protein [Actibacterium mucosum KCTC 23349]|uniref:Capsule biosynthesis protein n=1 Tax=Actibacterium mucosum KCTC 23349 TaxID=1454373 RepID=A0A037ZJU9_9RHOB|nr:capsule biosynthesis protein [Actibacterium mucosum]KAJ56368.1 capsule biosynthesis protein [Actibacterium mucosum KCTC 23349]